jgi:Na+/proline symporter
VGGSDGGSTTGHQHELALTVVDWIVLVCHLTLTLFVGLVVTSRKQSGDDAMLAGRSMSGVTIALSLISGLTSGISYLGFPAYILEDGVGQVFIFLAYFVVIPVGGLVLIPFFHSLNLVTAYTYFELRFGCVHRTIAAMLFISRVSLYLGVVLYAPALLLHTCLGFPLWATILFTGCLSTLWTIKGGMFAVVYTDAIQSIAMIIGMSLPYVFNRSTIM